jgi:hypothetical protein
VIQNSLEWNNVEITLRRQARKLANGGEVCKMIDNIRSEISHLSKAEVNARRGKKQLAEELLMKVNQDIEMVEEYLLVAALLG